MLLLCGWFGRILQSVFTDNEGCASKLCMLSIEKYGAEEKVLFKVRQRKKKKDLSPYFFMKSSTCCEQELPLVQQATSQINKDDLNTRHKL